MKQSFSIRENDTADKTVSFKKKSRERMITLLTLTSSEESSDEIEQPVLLGGY
jgi:hypothetical protein